jgi:hypothetical protein
MLERDSKSHKPSYVITQEFLTHLRGIEFGSPDYFAFCDFYELESQKYSHQIDKSNVLSGQNSPSKIDNESSLRITEVRIAMLENTIKDRQIRDIAYAKSFQFTTAKMDELKGSLAEEAKDEYPEPYEQDLRQKYIDDSYYDLLVDVFKNDIYRFYH